MLDPEPERSLGRDVLEALLYGVPVLARADGGAAREHAEAGNGGLWYPELRRARAGDQPGWPPTGSGPILGSQGRDYALREYGDPEGFRKRVVEAALG